MNKKEQKLNSLQEEFSRIQDENKDLDITKYLAKKEDLPDLGEVQIYDYDKDLVESVDSAEEVLDALFDLYFGDIPGIEENNYLMKKVKEDAQVYAETIFLQRMTRKNFLTQLKQVDNGDSSARMHEVVNQSISQIRDNIKFAQSQRTELEKYYRDMRKDYDRMMENIKQVKIEQGLETKADGKIVDARSLNDMIEKMLKNKD
jgi:thiamine kinase-like enzyme